MTQPQHIACSSQKDPFYTLLESELFTLYRPAFEKTTGSKLSLFHPEIEKTPKAEQERFQNTKCSLSEHKDYQHCQHCIRQLIPLCSRRATSYQCKENITTSIIPIHGVAGITAYLKLSSAQCDPQSQQAHLTLLGAFALQLSSTFSQSTRAEEHSLVTQAKQYIQKHFSEKITLDEIAAHVHVTPSYLCKQFKKETQHTIIDYCTTQRVNKARSLLQNTDTSIIEIAFSSGFQSLSQFNRSFKKIENTTPSQFRKKMKVSLS